jgi:hypothetical protein
MNSYTEVSVKKLNGGNHFCKTEPLTETWEPLRAAIFLKRVDP